MTDAALGALILQVASVVFAAGLVVREQRHLSRSVERFEERLANHDQRAVESRERIRALERRVFGRAQGSPYENGD